MFPGYAGAMLIREVRLGRGADVVDVRIRDGLIAQIGPGLARAGDEVLAGGGAFMIPGLWDQHVHTGQLAQSHARLDTTGVVSLAELLERVRTELAARGDDGGRALVGFGHRLLDLGAEPTVALLDAVTGAVPTVLIGGDAHHAWLNSAALAALALPPRRGIIAEDEWFAVTSRLPELPGVAEDVQVGMTMLQEQALARGVVGLVDMEWGVPFEQWPRRETRMRVRTAVYPDHIESAPGPTGTVLDAAGLVTMGPLKVIADGALGSHSAYTREPYSDGHGWQGRGVLSVPPPHLREALQRAKQLGLTAAVHAIGDAAAQVVLDAVEAVGISARIEHAQMLADEDVARMAALGVTASVQPAHLLDDRDVTEEIWPGRGGQAYRLRDLLSAGAPVVMGSDAPVVPLDPWLAMAAAVHRSADTRPGWYPAQQLQPGEVLAASTDGVQSLSAGGLGDVVLLEDWPFDPVPTGADGLMDDAAAREAAARLREVRVLVTVVAGRLAAQA